ncbi:MAG TPA: choice-of-anchor B family protein [Flavobacteriaceae bacterium]|nr:choice-of-anchor B family protein [Flavobacteriaceae bacterium]
MKIKKIHLFLILALISLPFLSCDNEPVNIVQVTDTDEDGIPDSVDNCPNTANPEQEDTNDDGIGDACDIQPLFYCENGFAGQYPCANFDLMSQVSLEELTNNPNAEGNDIWGWTDPQSGKEYALVATSVGTSFVDLSDTTAPIVLGNLATATTNSPWRDVKTYNNHAFIVSEAPGHGMQVFDLTRLRNVSNPPEDFTADALYTDFGSAHNIAINEESGFAYVVGSNTFSGGVHFVNIQNPQSPMNAGGYAGGGYSHDAQIVNYSGPDTEHAGKEIFIGANASKIVIVDVSDKTNPILISEASYNGLGYTHQGWLTHNQTYFILGDEVDELNFGNNTRTLVFDFSDLENPVFHSDYYGPSAAIDHNLYTKGNLVYQANYTSGFRLLSSSNVVNGTLFETGYFDTYPEDDSTSFHGAWSVYPYFQSGNIIISDIDRGLFVIKEQ